MVFKMDILDENPNHFFLFISPICVHESIQLKKNHVRKKTRTKFFKSTIFFGSWLWRVREPEKIENRRMTKEKKTRRTWEKKHINKMCEDPKQAVYLLFYACTLWPLFCLFIDEHSHSISFARLLYPHETIIWNSAHISQVHRTMLLFLLLMVVVLFLFLRSSLNKRGLVQRRNAISMTQNVNEIMKRKQIWTIFFRFFPSS